MKDWTLKDLEEQYDLDFEKIVDLIKKNNAKRILLQFPDGLKQYAKSIVNYLEDKTKKSFLIYFGTCFGACDTPIGLENMKIDLIIQIGHNSLMPNYLK
jgi:2-(3-amino-3-carboxypropyl)histidine synthase